MVEYGDGFVPADVSGSRADFDGSEVVIGQDHNARIGQQWERYLCDIDPIESLYGSAVFLHDGVGRGSDRAFEVKAEFQCNVIGSAARDNRDTCRNIADSAGVGLWRLFARTQAQERTRCTYQSVHGHLPSI